MMGNKMLHINPNRTLFLFNLILFCQTLYDCVFKAHSYCGEKHFWVIQLEYHSDFIATQGWNYRGRGGKADPLAKGFNTPACPQFLSNIIDNV